MQDRPSESTFALVVGALRASRELAGRTLALARTEIEGNLRALVGLLALLGAIVVLLVSAFFVFLDALVKALAVLIGSEVVAAALVASPFTVVAGILTMVGVRRIARVTALPERTLGRVRADARAVLPGRP
ncbi:phage holin family protein [uncultured Methylobacterium sp.]|uniref:phage holin family protein n=1 Tax=uncultured Methylobacterium sp. TaxID=157278 RepID=UPI0035CC5BA0